LRPTGAAPVLRSDNGLTFQSRRFRAACKDYRLEQEFITPYTPEQNGLIERFFRSLKEQCVWLQNFDDFHRARRKVWYWIAWYNESRPLGRRARAPRAAALPSEAAPRRERKAAHG
jgi:putative transposase